MLVNNISRFRPRKHRASARFSGGTYGVTLAELLIVLAILSISLGIVRVSAAAYPDKLLNAACAELQADLRYAQRQAVVENRKHEVIFPRGKNGYILSRLESGFGVSKTIKEKIFENGITLVGTTAANSTVVYTTRGTTGNACTITLKNDKYRVALTVNLGSGRIAQKEFTKIIDN